MSLLNSKSQLHFLTTRKMTHFRGSTKCNIHITNRHTDMNTTPFNEVLDRGGANMRANSRLSQQLAPSICELSPITLESLMVAQQDLLPARPVGQNSKPKGFHYCVLVDMWRPRSNSVLEPKGDCTKGTSISVCGAIPLLRFGGHVKAKVQQCARAQRWLHDISSRLKQNKWYSSR